MNVSTLNVGERLPLVGAWSGSRRCGFECRYFKCFIRFLNKYHKIIPQITIKSIFYDHRSNPVGV